MKSSEQEIQCNRKANGFPRIKVKGDHRLTTMQQVQCPSPKYEAGQKVLGKMCKGCGKESGDSSKS